MSAVADGYLGEAAAIVDRIIHHICVRSFFGFSTRATAPKLAFMWSFAVAVFLLIITPGPGVMTTAGIGAAYGFRAGVGFIAGLFVGNNLVGLAVITGLSALILASPPVRTVLTILSAGYLCYMAVKIAFAGSKIAFIQSTRAPGFRDGVLLQAINPKAYVVNTTLFSGFVIWPEAFLFEVIVKLIIFNVIWTPIHFLWLWAGVEVQRLNLAPHVQRRINIAMALAMLGVVGLAAVNLG